MALACLAAEAGHVGDKLRRQGFAVIDGSAVNLAVAAADFDALSVPTDASLHLSTDHPLVASLLDQAAVRDPVTEALGATPRVTAATAFDQQTPQPMSWHQAAHLAEHASVRRGLTLRWYLDLIGPADGGLRVLPGSHTKGRLTFDEIAVLAVETPASELAVSPGTVLMLEPLLVRGSRRRTTRGHRRILQVELTAA